MASNPAAARNAFVDLIFQEVQRQQVIQQEKEAYERQRQAQEDADRVRANEYERQRRAQAEAENARLNATRQTWNSLDGTVRLCMNRSLQKVGQSVDVMIKQGVVSSDPRLEDVMAKCNTISSQDLLQKMPCTIEGSPSICNEAYVLMSTPTVPLTPEQLVTALIAGQLDRVGKTQIEDAQSKMKRLAAAEERRKAQIVEQLLAKLGPLASPDNSFSVKKASALQKSIAAAKGNSRVSMDQLDRWSADVAALVDADRNEKLRVEKEKADKLARGEVDIKGAGSGQNKKAAVLNAYWSVFEDQLGQLSGIQADGDVRQSFRKKAEADFERFKASYFVAAAPDRCTVAGGQSRCEVTGVFKMGVLKADVQKLMAAAVGPGTADHRFILRYPDETDETTRHLIAQISAEFINRGYKIIAKSAEDEAEEKGQFDFYLSIVDISHQMHQDVTGNFVSYVLSARVKLLDNNKDPAKRLDLANVPVSNTKRTIRNVQTPLEARKKELLQAQGNELAGTILREVDGRLLTLAHSRQRSPSALARQAGDGAQYSVKLSGLSQRDRDKIRAVREAITRTLGTETAVDPAGTGDKSIEIKFEKRERFDPEDVVDALYAAFNERKSFQVKYAGSNAFVGQW
jgi:hypothetical protein